MAIADGHGLPVAVGVEKLPRITEVKYGGADPSLSSYF